MQSKKPSVCLRKKRLSNGNQSLYLDVYYNGKRSYEFLKMYLVPETTRKSKSENRDTLNAAESIRIKRLAELHEDHEAMKHSRTKLIDYISECISRKTGGTRKTYRNVLVASIGFFGKDFILEDITEKDIKAFFAYLASYRNRNRKDTVISQSTQNLYCNIFKTFLSSAAKDGLIRKGIADDIDVVGKIESMRQYLTVEELQRLASTKLNRWYKRAFIFSCLTGLRRSDIKKLVWGEVFEHDGMTRIIFRQKKTKEIEYLDISPQARLLMGERKGCLDKVFTKFQCDSRTNKSIQKWVESVGIDKKITFHCARHTFAVMMLTIGVDIYTTSKLLGHRELSTTQIYAKIVDKKKQEAVTKIPIVI